MDVATLEQQALDLDLQAAKVRVEDPDGAAVLEAQARSLREQALMLRHQNTQNIADELEAKRGELRRSREEAARAAAEEHQAAA